MTKVSEITSKAIADMIEYYKPAGGKIDQMEADVANLSDKVNQNSVQLGGKANQTDLDATIAKVLANTTAIGAKADAEYVNTQISTIGNASPKGVYASLSALQTAFPTGTTGIYVVTADGKWYYWTGSAWTAGGTYQGIAIADGTVTESKTPFFTVNGKNLFNRFTVTMGNYADWVAGALVANSGYNASDYIPITAPTTYTTNARLRSVVFYDANKIFISSLQNLTKGSNFDTPANAVFIRVTLYGADNNLSTYQLEKGLAPTAYEPYFGFNQGYLKPNGIDASQYIKDYSVNEMKASFFKVSTKNLLNCFVLISGSYVSPTTGVISYEPENFTYYVSELIPIQASRPYVCNRKIRSSAYYDSSKNFVSGVDTITNENASFTTPSNAAYMRINLYTADSGTQLEQNAVPTAFEPYFLFNGFLPPKSVTLDKLADGILTGSGVSKWTGKSFVSLGDSITWQDGQVYSGTSNIAVGYQTILKQKLGFVSYNNQGVSGRPMANGTANGAGTNTTGKSLTYSSYDLVIIAAATNDFKLNVVLGTKGQIGDTAFDTNTFYGAYRDLIEYILTNKPIIRIVLFTPLQRDSAGYDVNFTNTAGHKLIDYVNAIQAIGEMYGIPVCDMYRNSGFTKKTLSTFTLDGLHPNDTGYQRMGDYASSFINAI